MTIRALLLASALAVSGLLLTACDDAPAAKPTPTTTLPAGFTSMQPDHPTQVVGFRWTGKRCPKDPAPVAGVTACDAAELYSSDPCAEFDVEVTFRDAKGAETGTMYATAEHVGARSTTPLYYRYIPDGGTVKPSAAHCATP